MKDITRNAAGSLDGAAQEGCATFLLDGIVKVGLPTHEGAVCNTGSVRDGRHELDVLVEDIPGAGFAQLIGGKGR